MPWAAFVGAWLLFAGPIYQASIELGEEQIEREAIEATARSVPQPRRTAPWWWLVPPIGYLLERRQSTRYRKLVFDALSSEHQRQFVHYTEKASGWAYVAGGALLLATAETWSLCDEHGWPTWLFWVLAAAMAGLCGLLTVLRSRRAREMLGNDPHHPAAGRRPGGQRRQHPESSEDSTDPAELTGPQDSADR